MMALAVYFVFSALASCGTMFHYGMWSLLSLAARDPVTPVNVAVCTAVLVDIVAEMSGVVKSMFPADSAVRISPPTARAWYRVEGPSSCPDRGSSIPPGCVPYCG